MFIMNGIRCYSLVETAEKTGLPNTTIRNLMNLKRFEEYRDGNGGRYLTEKGYKAAIKYSKDNQSKVTEELKESIDVYKKKSKQLKKPKLIIKPTLEVNQSEYGPYIRFRTDDERQIHALIKQAAEKRELSLASYICQIVKPVLEG